MQNLYSWITKRTATDLSYEQTFRDNGPRCEPHDLDCLQDPDCPICAAWEKHDLAKKGGR